MNKPQRPSELGADKAEQDKHLEALAADYERQAREIRRKLLNSYEKQQMAALAACRAAMQVPLRFYFHAHVVQAQGVNLVDLEANHWIKVLARPLPNGLFYSDMTLIQMVYSNGETFGKAFSLENRRALQLRNEDLSSAWRAGTPFEITAWGYLSLAQGFPCYGLNIGEWTNGLDGQDFALRNAQKAEKSGEEGN